MILRKVKFSDPVQPQLKNSLNSSRLCFREQRRRLSRGQIKLEEIVVKVKGYKSSRDTLLT